ncbi:hypothetical protein [Halorarius litoreus]|uniref:hypothetical protein n=1 Tax=Halorarius litoreus TaxID=2962676 RepID=UPI0020CC093F|nr:hypothetical protein [Halorarius litoreus]
MGILNRFGGSALRLVASVFGILAGIGGITHGIGEIRQGNVAPDGLFFDSWTEGPIASQMGGDPAISLVPNLFVTGILTVLVSVVLIVWAAAFVQRPRGGWVLLGLSVVLLLVGGGVGSPVVGILAGVAGIASGASLTRFRTQLPDRPRRLLAALWPLAFSVALLNGLFLFVGAVVLVYLTDVGSAELFLNSFFFAVVSLLVTLLTGAAYDSQHRVSAEFVGKSPRHSSPLR